MKRAGWIIFVSGLLYMVLMGWVGSWFNSPQFRTLSLEELNDDLLLEAKKTLGSVQIGEVLEIWAGDAQTKNDMPRWCKKVGHEYLGDLVADGYERLFLKRLK